MFPAPSSGGHYEYFVCVCFPLYCVINPLKARSMSGPSLYLPFPSCPWGKQWLLMTCVSGTVPWGNRRMSGCLCHRGACHVMRKSTTSLKCSPLTWWADILGIRGLGKSSQRDRAWLVSWRLPWKANRWIRKGVVLQMQRNAEQFSDLQLVLGWLGHGVHICLVWLSGGRLGS